MKTIHFVAAAIMGLATAAHADVSKKDQDFITKAAAGGMYEVEAGKLAKAKGTSDGVKSYGDMLVNDHTAANEELKALATAKGATLPSALPADKTRKLEKMGGAKDFDRQFVKQVGQADHKTDIALFEKASKNADDAELKAFAEKTLPTLKAHKEHADGLVKSDKR